MECEWRVCVSSTDALVLLYVCLFVRSTISQQPVGRFMPYFACGRSLDRDVSSPLLGVSDPLGAKRGEMTWGWCHSCIGQLPFLFLSAMPNVVQYVGHRPAHILVQNRQDRPRDFHRVGQKVRKNFEFFTISRLYVHISQKLLNIEAYKQRMEKSFISPLSKCRMCLDHRSRRSIG